MKKRDMVYGSRFKTLRLALKLLPRAYPLGYERFGIYGYMALKG